MKKVSCFSFLAVLFAMVNPGQGYCQKGSLDQALERAVENSLDGYIAFLQEFLQIPNPRMQEHRSVRFIAQALEKAGCQVEVFEGEGRGEPTPDGPPLNIFASRKGDGKGRSLLLQAHIDNVPAGDVNRWTYPPWSGEIVGGRIYGRGSRDDRSGVAQLYMLVDLLNQLQIRTQGDLYLLITSEEEFSSGGIRAYAKRADKVQPDATIIVDGSQSILGNPGWLSFQIRIEGSFGSTQAQDKVHKANPIELMGGMIRGLRDLEQEVQQSLKDLKADPRWRPAFIAVTEIQSRGWISNVPEECVVRGLCNVIPPLTREQYKTRFEDFIQEVAQASAWLRAHPPEVSWEALDLPAMKTYEDSPVYQVLREAHRRNFGTPLEAHYGGWGDLQLLGNTILYGSPGGGNSHGYDEYYELKDLAPTLKTLVHLVTGWCGQSEAEEH